jgi:hypothetical protein
MFPNHCKEVSVKKVDFPLKEGDIRNNLLNRKAYKRTNYIVLNHKDEWAIAGIKKDMASELFGTINQVNVVSLPDSTIYTEDDSINVLSPTMMAEKAEELGCKTLIVKGKFHHVSFIHEEEMKPLLIYEVVPPNPPKLIDLVKTALYSGNVKAPIKVIPKILNLNDLAKESQKEIIIFPCQASQLIGERSTLYLDELPELSTQDKEKVALVGCDLSLRIFKEHYDFEPKFYNFCPQKRAETEDPDIVTLIKCCQVKENHLFKNNIAVVPWGATQKEVEDAINILTEK